VPTEPTVDACRAAARLARQVEVALQTVDLTLPQYRLLTLLTEGEHVANHLADLLSVSPPSVTALVDGLAERGLVERRPDPGDRRRVSHAITPAGLEALAAGDAAIGQRLGHFATRVPVRVGGLALRGLEAWKAVLDAARSRKLSRSE
jgi:long-chain acyl-CoA synthetase